MDARGVFGVAVVVALAAFVGGLVVGLQVNPSGGTTAAPTVTEAPDLPETAAPTPERRSRAERLLAEYACWTGEIPAGRAAPTHAVVTLPGERAELVDADTGFAIWLDGAPGVLHGFCP
jgi:hypothetical protein